MGFFDSFTRKPGNKRDDMSDDSFTQRPERDSRGPRSARPEGGMTSRPAAPQGRPTSRPAAGRPESRFGEAPRPASRPAARPSSRMEDGPRPASRPGARPAARPSSRFEEGPRPAPRSAVRPGPAPRPVSARPAAPVRPAAPRPAPRPAPAPADVIPEENLLVGRNPIREAIRSGRDFEKLMIARGELMGSAIEIVAMARERGIVIQEVDRARLDAIAPAHQGMIGIASAYAYHTIDDMLALAASRNEPPMLVILDGITDPHNLGAIIRSAECAGAHGIIIPERRAVGLTAAAVKASAGAVEHIPVARETNITRTIERLKKAGIWIYGTDMNGTDYRKVDFRGPVALVIGSEGDGISRLVRESCDFVVSLPLNGQIDSLNASVAAGVLLYAIEAARKA